MPEWEFLSEVVELADCGILLVLNFSFHCYREPKITQFLNGSRV